MSSPVEEPVEIPGDAQPEPAFSVHRSKTAPPPTTDLPQSPPEGLPGTTILNDQQTLSPPSQGSPAPGNALALTDLPESGASTSYITPAMRRTSSNVSAGSSAPGSREKKRLRFTQISLNPDQEGLAEGGEGGGDVFFPGSGLEEGRGKAKGRRIPKDQGYLRSDPGTPNLTETADQIRRTLSLASLDALLVLSANQAGERDRFIAEVSRAGRDLVWRDKDDVALYPRDTERAVVLAAKRGLRSFLLAFSVRAGVNVLLTLVRTIRKKGVRLRLILHAIFGAESFRFGATIGTFTFLNTLTLHLLRLSPPLSYIRRRVRAGIFSRPSFGPPEREGPEGERRWQAAVAGAVGSLGLLWETTARRRGVAQQMFVRGLQGSYNQYAPRMGIHIPHGDVLLFGLCCGQIMFAFLLSPETIPKEYSKWILNASKVPEFAILGNRTAARQGFVEEQQLQRALSYKYLTPTNASELRAYLEKFRAGWKTPAAVPCEMVHPWLESCTETSFRRFFDVFRWMLPVYSALHLIPMLVLRRHHFKRDPLRMLARAIWGITRSCSFLGAFAAVYQSLFCLRSQTLLQGWTPEYFRSLLQRKETFWLLGFSTCISLFLEEKKRRAELAMYVLPRALESAWSSLRKRAYVPIVPFGETILGAAAMAMVMDAYKHQPEALSGIVRRLMFQLVGPV